MDHGLNFQVSLEVERNELRYSPKWMGLIHYVHRLEHFEEFTQKHGCPRKNISSCKLLVLVAMVQRTVPCWTSTNFRASNIFKQRMMKPKWSHVTPCIQHVLRRISSCFAVALCGLAEQGQEMVQHDLQSLNIVNSLVNLTPKVVLHHWLYPWWILKLAFLLWAGFIRFSLKCLQNLRPPSFVGSTEKIKAYLPGIFW